jgi:hypothetical protein
MAGFQDRVWAVQAEARTAQAAQFAASVVPLIREGSGNRPHKLQCHRGAAQRSEGGDSGLGAADA